MKFPIEIMQSNIQPGLVKYASAVDSSFTLVVCLKNSIYGQKTMTRNNNKHTNFCNLQRDLSMTWEKGKYKVIQEQIVNRWTKEETENQKEKEMNGSKCMKRMYETKENERENRRALNSSRKYMLKVRRRKILSDWSVERMQEESLRDLRTSECIYWNSFLFSSMLTVAQQWAAALVTTLWITFHVCN